MNSNLINTLHRKEHYSASLKHLIQVQRSAFTKSHYIGIKILAPIADGSQMFSDSKPSFTVNEVVLQDWITVYSRDRYLCIYFCLGLCLSVDAAYFCNLTLELALFLTFTELKQFIEPSVQEQQMLLVIHSTTPFPWQSRIYKHNNRFKSFLSEPFTYNNENE